MAHMEARSGAYRYVNSENYNPMPFCIDMAGVDRCTSNYCVVRENSPISVMGITIKGNGFVTQNGKTVEAKKGSLFLVNCKEFHEYHSGSEWEITM